jgi:hypothetical protein
VGDRATAPPVAVEWSSWLEWGIVLRRHLSQWNGHHGLSDRCGLHPRYGCGGAIEALVLCLRGEGRSILPSLSEVVWNSSMESYVIACNGDNVPPRVEPMTAAPEPSATGEMLRPLKRYVMNSSLPKKVVSPREKTSHDRHSPSTMTVSTDEGTIETSRGKAHCKSPYLAHQLLVFFTPIRYRVVKITCSYSEVVLRTTKHTIIYPSSGPSLEVIALHLAV